MTDTCADWTGLAARLADTLTERGDLHDPAWRAAVAAVPRHLLVPAAWEQDGYGTWLPVDLDSDEGRALVYSPQTLVTALEDRGTYTAAISSSTKPDLMLRMLETLDVHDGHRVLEIGAGTGYNAALLSHRLGADNVFSVDLDRELVDAARDRLAAIGYEPTLVTTDGIYGLPEHAPYDRIITTCSTPAVPWTWVDQLTPEGRMLVDLKVNTAGNLVDLRRFPDRAEGRFTGRWAAFMIMRHPTDVQPAAAPAAATTTHGGETVERHTTTPPQPWATHREVWFIAQFSLPAGLRVGMRLDPETRAPTAATVSAPDGSRAVVELTDDAGVHHVREAGPTRLWTEIERAHQQWMSWGEPDWPRFGLTVDPVRQWVWLDDPTGPHTWQLTEET